MQGLYQLRRWLHLMWDLLEQLICLSSASYFDQIVLEHAIIHKSSEGLLVNRWKQKQSVQRRYNITAKTYDQRYCNEQTVKYRAALDNITISKDAALLDVGCSTGLFFSHIANKAGLLVGLDLSRELLLQANKRAKHYKNVFLVLGDADNLPFIDQFFNSVFIFTVLQNMPTPSTTLNEISRATKPDAHIVVTALKRAIPLETFSKLLKKAKLSTITLKGDDALQCYVVISIKNKDASPLSP